GTASSDISSLPTSSSHVLTPLSPPFPYTTLFRSDFLHPVGPQNINKCKNLLCKCLLMAHPSFASNTFSIGVNLTCVSSNSFSLEDPLTIPHPANRVTLFAWMSMDLIDTTNSESLSS